MTEDNPKIDSDAFEEAVGEQGGELDEREVIMIPFELDPAHRRMDLALREHGIDVKEYLSLELTPAVESKIYGALQQTKYPEQ